MSKVSIKIDGGAIDRAREMLSSVPGGVGKILPRAINRALTAGRAQVSKSVRENYTVAAAEIKKTLHVTKASKSEPSGEIVSQGMQLPLREFKHSPADESTTGGKRRKVRVTIAKGSPFNLERGFKWRGHIFARQAAGIKSRVYFDAKGKKRRGEPIKRLAGPSVPSMLEGSAEKVSARMHEVFERRLQHEAEVLLEKIVK